MELPTSMYMLSRALDQQRPTSLRVVITSFVSILPSIHQIPPYRMNSVRAHGEGELAERLGQRVQVSNI